MKIKKWIAIMLALCLALSWLPAMPVLAAETSGICGDDLTWSLNDDGVLTIVGNGDMYHYGVEGNGEAAPWSAYAAEIKELVIDNAVTMIGHEAFRGCTALTEFDVPTGLKSLGYRAFAGCTGLRSVTIARYTEVLAVSADVFLDCTNLTDIYLNSEVMNSVVNKQWFDHCRLLDYAERIYVGSYIENVTTVISNGFACDNVPQTVEVDGVSYRMYSKGEHAYQTTVAEPACTEDGANIYQCQVCGYSYKQSLAATGHLWDENYICLTCGYVANYLVDLNLVMEELVVVDGIYYTAEGQPVVIAIGAPISHLNGDALMYYVDGFGEIGFSMTYWKKLVEMMDKEGFVPLTEETMVWFLDLITGNPDWGEDESYLPKYLGIQIVRSYEHEHEYATFVTEPACTEQGYTAYVCKICGDTYHENYVDAAGHNYATVTTNPTCTKEGYTTYTCTACGDSYRTDYVEPTGFGPWIVVTAPTFDAPGEAYRVCADCGKTETVEMKQKASSVPLTNLSVAFQDALGMLDYFYDFNTEYMIRVTTDYFLEDFDFWAGVCVSAEAFEAVLRMYFEVDDATIESVRLNGNDPDWFYYDEIAQTYTFSFMGGFGGIMPPREFVGYVQNGDTYEVYYAQYLYSYLQDVLPEGVDEWEYAEELGWPYEIEYEGVVYTEGPDGYVAILGLADYGRKYTVEITENLVRILSCVDYTEADLPDHLHCHEATVIAPTCTEQGYTLYTCECGDSYQAEYTENVDHDYVDGACRFCGLAGVNILDSGTCGENLSWTLSEDGVLTISGTGPMENYNHIEDVFAPWYDHREKITSVVIDGAITTIGDWAFALCENLTGINIPDTVTYLGAWAFQNCTGMTDLTIGTGVEEICWGTFSGCISLPSVTIPNSVTSIGETAFGECLGLNSVIIGDGVTSIGDYAFEWCQNLTDVTFGKNVTSIGKFAFRECLSLNNITLPGGVTEISRGVFNNCDSLTNITFTEGLVSIGENAFFACDGLTTVVLPKTVTHIGESAFESCGSLTEITFLGDAPAINEYAFWGVTATAYYPAGNETWTQEVMLSYGGTITWVASGAPAYAMGDVNGDGKVNTTDAKMMMQFDLGLIGEDALSLDVADVNGDGKVNTTDAKLVMQLDLGLIEQFP